MSYLYILETNSLSEAFFSNIFTQSVSCLFALFVVFLVEGEVCCTKAFKFILVIFVSISITLGDRSKKTLLRFMSNSVVPMISSRSLGL